MKGGFPIAGYNELNVNEGADKLDGLTEEHLKTVREYEKRNKNRTHPHRADRPQDQCGYRLTRVAAKTSEGRGCLPALFAVRCPALLDAELGRSPGRLCGSRHGRVYRPARYER